MFFRRERKNTIRDMANTVQGRCLNVILPQNISIICVYLKTVLIIIELCKSNSVMLDTTVNLYFGIDGK